MRLHQSGRLNELRGRGLEVVEDEADLQHGKRTSSRALAELAPDLRRAEDRADALEAGQCVA